MPSQPPFVARSPYDPSHPHALAVYCSDGRFTASVEELLGERGHGRLDTLTIPGGAALLHLWSAGYAESNTVRQATSFLIRGHAIREVVLVAHSGCGYYRHRYPTLAPEQLVDRQQTDLVRAAGWIAIEHRDVVVHGYFAEPDGKRVRFRSVPVHS